MATILLQVAGAALGGLFGSFGATIGLAAGALAGNYIDRALINSTKSHTGPRLDGMQPFTAEEGRAIPRVYGTMRMSGTLVWATRFEEVRRTERQGGKGGPKVTTYSYFANAAFAVCEGEIAGIRRIWADGREIDQNDITFRVMAGTATQPADPLIEARQGAGNTPAYRNTAVIVIERFPLDEFGNRLPQFHFEVIRPIGRLEKELRAVCLIPGSTTFGLSPTPQSTAISVFASSTVNRNALHGQTDWQASLDELLAICPNIKHVALVVSWFADNLSAGQTSIRPLLPAGTVSTAVGPWSVCGIGAEAAALTSSISGKAAFGGTPADASVIAAIADLKARGVSVTLYPFVLMDIAPGNGLADPYGGAEQAAYPWRGRITVSPAPGVSGSPDGTAASAAAVAAFSGSVSPSAFAVSAGQAIYSGSAGDFGYRRFILHCANLCRAAGGVDTFVIGSEMRGLTTVRGVSDSFPFVEALRQMAGDVRQMLGTGTKLTYAADWTEYFGFQPGDGSGDVFYHLDPLWADPVIDAVGIDNYMPLADWSVEDAAGGNPDGARSALDPVALLAATQSGEGFDWYYAGSADRQARQRTPITDGGHGKPWVYRYKDIAEWWSNPHIERRGGVEIATTSPWQPGMKPVWFTETGSAAVHAGPNQPNVFPDPKSSENAKPYGSNGGRDDLAPLRYLQAMIDGWRNVSWTDPQSGQINQIVDPNRIYAWAWDARPYPAFPLRDDVWGDAENWRTGHWLNGRLGCAPLDELVNSLMTDVGLAKPDSSALDGFLSGYVVDQLGDVRSHLEPLLEAFGATARERAGVLELSNSAPSAIIDIAQDQLVADDEIIIETAADRPAAASAMLRDPLQAYQSVTAEASGADGTKAHREVLSLPAAGDVGTGLSIARQMLDTFSRRGRALEFAIAPQELGLETGDTIRLAGQPGVYRIGTITEGSDRAIKAELWLPRVEIANLQRTPANPKSVGSGDGSLSAHVLDLPLSGGQSADATGVHAAAWHATWRSVEVSTSRDGERFSARATVAQPARLGIVESAVLGPVMPGRLDQTSRLTVRMARDALESVSVQSMLNGANAAVVRCANGAWEALQFADAEEIEADVWQIRALLRGQLGTDAAARSVLLPGAPFLVIDNALVPIDLADGERGIELQYRFDRAGKAITTATSRSLVANAGLVSLTPLEPVHLRARQDELGNFSFEWIRRDRSNVDGWDRVEMPLSESREAYALSIETVAGAVVHSVTVEQPSYTYPQAGRLADLGDALVPFRLTIAQTGDAYGAGRKASLLVSPAITA